MKSKSLILVLIVVILGAMSVFAVMAQDDDTPAPFFPGWMHHSDDVHFPGHGMGMMWNNSDDASGTYRFGMMGMMWQNDEPMMYAVAEALGLESDEFIAALQGGQTLAEIAEAQGVELDTVYAAMSAHAQDHMAELVAAGTITQEQADAHLTWMQENLSTMPMFSGAGFGPCMDGQAATFGPGMMMGRMGHGHWGRSS